MSGIKPMATPTLTSPNYRPDIDGLRAVAVLVVVLHHLSASFMPGGYVGVDVFFVISGYLITRIISREMEEGTSTFARFYERRVRRIYPPRCFPCLLRRWLRVTSCCCPPTTQERCAVRWAHCSLLLTSFSGATWRLVTLPPPRAD